MKWTKEQVSGLQKIFPPKSLPGLEDPAYVAGEAVFILDKATFSGNVVSEALSRSDFYDDMPSLEETRVSLLQMEPLANKVNAFREKLSMVSHNTGFVASRLAFTLAGAGGPILRIYFAECSTLFETVAAQCKETTED